MQLPTLYLFESRDEKYQRRSYQECNNPYFHYQPEYKQAKFNLLQDSDDSGLESDLTIANSTSMGKPLDPLEDKIELLYPNYSFLQENLSRCSARLESETKLQSEPSSESPKTPKAQWLKIQLGENTVDHLLNSEGGDERLEFFLIPEYVLRGQRFMQFVKQQQVRIQVQDCDDDEDSVDDFFEEFAKYEQVCAETQTNITFGETKRKRGTSSGKKESSAKQIEKSGAEKFDNKESKEIEESELPKEGLDVTIAENSLNPESQETKENQDGSSKLIVKSEMENEHKIVDGEFQNLVKSEPTDGASDDERISRETTKCEDFPAPEKKQKRKYIKKAKIKSEDLSDSANYQEDKNQKIELEDLESNYINQIRIHYGMNCGHSYKSKDDLFENFVKDLSQVHFEAIKDKLSESKLKKMKKRMLKAEQKAIKQEEGTDEKDGQAEPLRYYIRERPKLFSVRCTEEGCKFELRFIKIFNSDTSQIDRINFDVCVRKFHTGAMH